MVPFNLLLLPLLGGFIFVSKWYPTRYYTLRTDGYRLIFTTAVAGAALLFFASVLKTYLAPHLPFWPATYVMWHQLASPEHSGTAALAMLLGALLWRPLNLLGKPLRLLSDELAINRAIRGKRDALEMFLKKAMESEKMISVSVKNGKVYVGYLTSNYNPAFPMESISLILAFSGHRSEDTKAAILDINYIDIYKEFKAVLLDKLLETFQNELRKNPKASDDTIFAKVMLASDAGEEWEIIIPIEEVQSVNVFHVDSYNKLLGGAYRIPAPPAAKQKKPRVVTK
jgi:hypothetical protein